MENPQVKKKGKFHKHQWIVLFTVMIASFLGRLDGTIVGLATPHIIKDFGITISQAAWISTAYIIANAIFVPIFGKLGDLIGRKPLYIFGILGFVVTSALAGLSFNLPSMIFFRILQAITVSIDYPLALSIIAYTFEDRKDRAVAMGMWSAIFGVAVVFGPLLGGPLIDLFSWRSVFYINIPLGAIGALMASIFIEEPVKKIKGLKNFDIFGSILLGLGLGAMVLVLDQGQGWGWTSFVSICFYIVTVISLILFILVEKKQKEPVVDLKFFNNITFTAAIVTSFITFMGMMGGIFLIPLFAQNYLGYSVTKSGYVFIPMALGIMLSAQIGARLSAKIAPRYLLSVGMIWGAFTFLLLSQIDIKWSFWQLSFHLFLMATGIGLGMAPLTNAATSTVPLEEIGVASSILALARNIAGAFGIAIFATILTNTTNSYLLAIQSHSIINNVNPQMLKMVSGLISVKANILAFSTVFRTAAIFMLLGAISAFFVKESKRDFESDEELARENNLALEI